MADYIYLLQHRLTPTQRKALDAVRDAARGRGMPVFLVGGAVRDLTSGAPVRDLDFAVQGDVASLVEVLEGTGASRADVDAVFQSHYFVFPGGVRVEVGPTFTASYPKPGEPEVQPASILDDLRRRDFTANAMAVSLNEGSYGLLLDPLNGVADLENRELRLVSNLGFIEQPALLVRAARLGARLGWALEERTQRRYENAKEDNAIERLSETARSYELEEIFHEEDPVAAMEHLEGEGWLNELSPLLAALKVDRDGLDKVRDTLGHMEHLGIYTDPSPVYFPLLVGKLGSDEGGKLKAAFARPNFIRQIESLESRGKELISQLNAKGSSAASATWKLLFAAEPEVVLSLASSTRQPALQARFKAFFNEWPQARQKVPYALLQEMRITPEIQGYPQLLEDLFFGLIDGKLSTPEELRAFLEPFSPPAPAQQAAPRRRAAKSARGRGRQAAAVAAPVETETEEEDSDLERELAGRPSQEPDRSGPDMDGDEADDEEDIDKPDSPAPEPRVAPIALGKRDGGTAAKEPKAKSSATKGESKAATRNEVATPPAAKALPARGKTGVAPPTPSEVSEAPAKSVVADAPTGSGSKAQGKSKEQPAAPAKLAPPKVVVVPAAKAAAAGKSAPAAAKETRSSKVVSAAPEKVASKSASRQHTAKPVAGPAKKAEKKGAPPAAGSVPAKALPKKGFMPAKKALPVKQGASVTKTAKKAASSTRPTR